MALLRLLAVAGFAAVVLPGLPSAQAQDVLNADALAQFGGTYRVRCDDRASAQVAVSAGSLVVTRAKTRVTGQGLQAAYAWFGQSPPADFQVALLSQARSRAWTWWHWCTAVPTASSSPSTVRRG